MAEFDVLMGFDANYAMPASVAMRSLGLALDDGESVNIHVLGVGLDPQIKRRISDSTPKTVHIAWHDFDEEMISDLPSSSIRGEEYITKSAYTLLFLDRYLPGDIERLIFLDADILVRRSPSKLIEIDLEGRTLAAVRDFGCGTVSMPGGVAGWREIGLDGRAALFNSGILVIDRTAWRANDIEQRSVEYLAAFRPKISYVDQDCLNASNAGHWVELDPAWNYQTHIEWDLGGDDAVAYAFIEQGRLDSARRDPAVVHYAGSIKPWHELGRTLPFLTEWRATLEGTAWRGTPAEPEPKNSAFKAIKYRVRGALRALAGR